MFFPVRFLGMPFGPFQVLGLRGPVAILFSYRAILAAIVSQNSFVLVFVGGGGGIAQLSRDILQNGVSHRCAFVKLSTKGGYRTILGEC